MRNPPGLTLALALMAMPLAAEESGGEFPSVAVPDVRGNVIRMLERSRDSGEAPAKDETPEAGPVPDSDARPTAEPKRFKRRPPQPRVIRRPIEHTELPETTITIREYLDVDDLEMAIDEANRRRSGGAAGKPSAQ